MKFICRLMGHTWETTGVNGFYHPTEKQCARCGEFTHLVCEWKNQGNEPWKPGRHPKSPKIPEVGKSYKPNAQGQARREATLPAPPCSASSES